MIFRNVLVGNFMSSACLKQICRLNGKSEYPTKGVVRFFDTQTVTITEHHPHDHWITAQPFESIPRPTKFQLISRFFPGGRYHGKSLVELNRECRREFGDIFLLPGIFGKRDVVFTLDPVDFQKIFRTEGRQPIRRGLDILHYYRKIYRKDLFENAAGLIAEQGQGWAKFRSAVNPVMVNPKAMCLYVPKINNVMDIFLQRIRSIRDPFTNEVPGNFEDELNHWAMDVISLIALDTQLNLINHSERNPAAKEVIDGMRTFFELLFDLDLKPSLWKIMPTMKFYKVINIFDKITELTILYIDEAIERVKKKKNQNRTSDRVESEKSVLENLLDIDRNVAIVMAMDLFLGGVDVTMAAMASCLMSLALNPEKQMILRQEIVRVLPEKNSPLLIDKTMNLSYLRACIKESFRTHPVSVVNSRTTGQDLVLSGYRVPKDTDIVMPFQLLTDDPKYFDRPEQFLPERWLRENRNELKNRIDPFVMLPFGFGPRVCIGKRFVSLLLEIAIARLVRNFHISFDYPTENAFEPHIINVPVIPLRFKFVDVE